MATIQRTINGEGMGSIGHRGQVQGFNRSSLRQPSIVRERHEWGGIVDLIVVMLKHMQ